MKLQAIISGEKVHDVGHRIFLLNISLNSGIQRFNARNIINNSNQQVIVKVTMEKSITGEIYDLRTDIRSYLDRKLSIMELDIQQIKQKIGLM